MGSTQVDVPFTDEQIDPTDPAAAGKSVGFMIIGFTILVFALLFGSHFAQSLQGTVSSALGLDTDGSTNIEVV